MTSSFVSLSVTPEKTNEIVNYIAFAFVYGYNENEMTVDNAEVNISPLIQSSEDSDNGTQVYCCYCSKY